jgi:class 3 adenylate cyclase
MDINEELLSTSLKELERLLPDSGELRGLLESFVRTASDEELVRINPVAFALSHGIDEAALIDLFLHGRKVGLLRMEWQYVCPGCDDIVESFQSLTSATAHFFCQVCSADREADLSEFIEITFSAGPQLLSNQTFLDLFESETIVAAEGLAVKRLALLFTDIQGSTALYDRIGDMKAFDLVRLHFGYLRDSIAGNSGALVKTIGDAVMASFHDPLDALRAALDMHAQIARFNADAGDDLIGLKVGVHVGTCLAVTLNGRLDYFGQAVNLAARVQALSGANEIYLTDEMRSIPGAEGLLAAFDTETRSVQLKGVQGDVRVHRVYPRVGNNQ